MAYRILLRRDSSANWETNNPVLLSGEPGYETDTNKLKIGDGVTAWSDLDEYITGPTGGTGPTGSVGATGPTGSAGTGPNIFYGNQTIGPSGGTAGTLILAGYSSLGFTGDAPAAAAGVPLGGVYHTAGALKIRLT